MRLLGNLSHLGCCVNLPNTFSWPGGKWQESGERLFDNLFKNGSGRFVGCCAMGWLAEAHLLARAIPAALSGCYDLVGNWQQS